MPSAGNLVPGLPKPSPDDEAGGGGVVSRAPLCSRRPRRREAAGSGVDMDEKLRRLRKEGPFFTTRFVGKDGRALRLLTAGVARYDENDEQSRTDIIASAETKRRAAGSTLTSRRHFLMQGFLSFFCV